MVAGAGIEPATRGFKLTLTLFNGYFSSPSICIPNLALVR